MKKMKKIFYLLLIGITTISCNSQNTISLNDLTINGKMVIGENNEVITSLFGQPSSTENSFSEMDDKQMSIYKYDGLTLILVDNQVSSFEIFSSNFNFGNNEIKIGDNIQKLQELFPESYNKKGADYITVWIENTDMYVNFHLSNEKYNNVITKISVGNY